MTVVDAIRVLHTKPVDFDGGAFYRKMQSLGVQPRAEYEAMQKVYPGFGARRSLRRGHIGVCSGLPDGAQSLLAGAFESVKKRAHRVMTAGWFRSGKGPATAV